MDKNQDSAEQLPIQQKIFNMKKIFFLFFLLTAFCILGTSTVFAISPTPTPTDAPPTPTSKPNPLDQQINSLKDRIASRVAQLKLVQRRGVIGIVTDISDISITLSDLHNKTRLIDVDELTKFSSPSAKGAFGISDITKGTVLGILGLYNKQSERILARFVDVLVFPKVLSGTVVSLDNENYAFQLAAEDKQYTIDIETTTKTLSYTKEAGSTRFGFSKMTPHQHVVVVAYQNLKDKNRFSAGSLMIFPSIPANPKIAFPTSLPTPTSVIKPTTTSQSPSASASGKKTAR